MRLINYKGQKNPQSILQQKRICKKKQRLAKRQFKIEYIPSFNSISEVQTLYLEGEIFIILDFDNRHFESDRLSCLNNYKRVFESIIHKKSRFLEIKLEQKEQNIQNFSQLAQNLFNYPDQTVHELGILLQFYNDFCQKKKIKQMVEKHSKGKSVYRSRDVFEQQKQQFLDNFNQEEFLCLIDMTFDSENCKFITNSILPSEPFLYLMGTTLEQYQRYVLRFGLNLFIDSKGQLLFNIAQLKQFLSIYGDYGEQYSNLKNYQVTDPVYVNLHTFDNIKIPTKITYHTLLLQVNQMEKQNCCYDKNLHMLIAVKHEICPTQLEQIIGIRQNNQQQNNNEVVNQIDYQLDYQLQSEIFMEMQQYHSQLSQFKQRASYKQIEQQKQQQQH